MNEILQSALKHNYYFWIFAGLSIALIIVSFVLPPTGSIDPSVLTATGELFGWAALGAFIKGLDKGADLKVKKGDTEIQVENPDKKD